MSLHLTEYPRRSRPERKEKAPLPRARLDNSISGGYTEHRKSAVGRRWPLSDHKEVTAAWGSRAVTSFVYPKKQAMVKNTQKQFKKNVRERQERVYIMTNEEKILEMLTQMQGQMTQMQSQQGLMQAQLDKLQDELHGTKADLGGVKDDIHGVKAYLELDVEKRFDAVNEGIDAILEKMFPVDRVEKLEDDVVVLKTAFKMLAQDVAELKKAQ